MSENGKMEFSKADSPRQAGRSLWTNVSILILSLLLSATVATIIYMALQNTPSAKSCDQVRTRGSGNTITTNVQVEEDGTKEHERLSYDEGGNIAYFYDDNGGFTAEDYDKGMAIVKAAGANVCLVIPTGNSVSRDIVRSVVSGYSDGDVISSRNKNTIHVQVLPGFIEDTSMFSDETNRLCTGGYKWVTTVDEDAEGAFETSLREKRQADEDCVCPAIISLVYIDSDGDLLRARFAVCIPFCRDESCTLHSYCITDDDDDKSDAN